MGDTTFNACLNLFCWESTGCFCCNVDSLQGSFPEPIKSAECPSNTYIHDLVDDVCVESSFTGTGVKGTVNMKIERFSKSSSTSGLPIVLSCLMFAVGLTGCGEAVKPWEIVVPASGKITFEGKPVEGAELTLTPVSAEVPATVRPSANSVADGSFTLGTYGTGAPGGNRSGLRHPCFGFDFASLKGGGLAKSK